MDVSRRCVRMVNNSVMKILLASGSPRRRELLGKLDVNFETLPSREVDEVYPSDLVAEEVPVYLSALKAGAYSDLIGEGDVLLTADTVVICDGEILGKPDGRRGAFDMLNKLSGKTHTVVTGVTLTTQSGQESFAERTRVTFAPLSDEAIDYYLDRYRPYDKAGAYGIQEWIGCVGISSIEGCFYNVMGLPLHALYTRLNLLNSECRKKIV